MGLFGRHPTGLAEVFAVGFQPNLAVSIALIVSIGTVVGIYFCRHVILFRAAASLPFAPCKSARRFRGRDVTPATWWLKMNDGSMNHRAENGNLPDDYPFSYGRAISLNRPDMTFFLPDGHLGVHPLLG
jgi:hypothetical protein